MILVCTFLLSEVSLPSNSAVLYIYKQNTFLEEKATEGINNFQCNLIIQIYNSDIEITDSKSGPTSSPCTPRHVRLSLSML